MDEDVAIELQQFVVAGGEGEYKAGIAEQPGDAVQQSQRLEPRGGQRHMEYGVFVAGDGDHALIELLQQRMGDPIVVVQQIGFRELQVVE